MEASVSTDGDTQAADAGTETQQEAPQAQVSPDIVERLNELTGFREDLQPVLQFVEQQQHQGQPDEEQPGFDEHFDENGMVLDPDGLQSYIQQQIQQGVQSQMEQTTQGLQQVQQFLQDQELDGLADDYPELQQPEVATKLAQEANAWAQSRNMPQLATDPEFVEMVYLAGKAMEQAQQGVPAGDQGVHLEGGSGNPGQPTVDATQERFQKWAAQGSSGGFWDRPLD
jgi:hypothetical protein